MTFPDNRKMTAKHCFRFCEARYYAEKPGTATGLIIFNIENASNVKKALDGEAGGHCGY